jgi:hypothetical protein
VELDTAVRHKLPLLCIISLNRGWTADPAGNKPDRLLVLREDMQERIRREVRADTFK